MQPVPSRGQLAREGSSWTTRRSACSCVILIASLFIVSEGIDSAGVTTWVGQWVIAHAGQTRSRLIVAIGLIAAVLSATITLNGSVAALLPLVVMLAVRIGEPPSRMLMPLSFIGGAGALLMLPGSPVNIIVSDAAADAGEGQFAFFEPRLPSRRHRVAGPGPLALSRPPLTAPRRPGA
ncbi:MAG: anion permease [Intrasporangium sp.]|uniref:SLC13 family permease n=1 Tax=Intrasporangium sp. TaxID=1925024 RepID=UPI002649D91A|nr:SLC13 family permease [Intrasporangium sp.]MDN5796845.1 anion permease [Intrasporangium sp.]